MSLTIAGTVRRNSTRYDLDTKSLPKSKPTEPLEFLFSVTVTTRSADSVKIPPWRSTRKSL